MPAGVAYKVLQFIHGDGQTAPDRYKYIYRKIVPVVRLAQPLPAYTQAKGLRMIVLV